LNGLDPDIEILRADPLLQRISHLRPQVFHGLDPEQKRYNEEIIDGMDRPDQKRKTYSFLIGYQTLFTMFPQLWINEIKEIEGK
jgi:hypothetical protein